MENILAYVPSINRFVDRNDVIIHDISSLLNHWQVQKWMQDGFEDMSIRGKDGSLVHILCLDVNEETIYLITSVIKNHTELKWND